MNNKYVGACAPCVTSIVDVVFDYRKKDILRKFNLKRLHLHCSCSGKVRFSEIARNHFKIKIKILHLRIFKGFSVFAKCFRKLLCSKSVMEFQFPFSDFF